MGPVLEIVKCTWDNKLYILQQNFQKFSNYKVQSYFILTNTEPLVKILFEKQPHLTNLNNVIVLKFFVSYVGPVLEIVKFTWDSKWGGANDFM